MIKYFTYYSFGGYKDIYVGSDSDYADASYFVPLLNVWKKSNKPENVDKLAKAEKLKQVELITKSNAAGFPADCNLMFSHGGYSAIYRTLSDGRTCLCIRDIPNGTKDEEGRDIPFTFMFLADSEESIDKLDVFALQYLTNIKETNSLIASAITYDYIINGFKFDLVKLDSLFSSDLKYQSKLIHRCSYVDYLLVGSYSQISLAVKEQDLDARKVNAVFDSERLIGGELDYKKVPLSELEEAEKLESDHDSEPDEVVSVRFPDLTNKSEDSSTRQSVTENQVVHPMELHYQEIVQRLSCLASKDDIESLKSLIINLPDANNDNFDKILSTLETMKQSTESSKIALAQDNIHSLFKNQSYFTSRTYIISICCLIVGIVLGALIF